MFTLQTLRQTLAIVNHNLINSQLYLWPIYDNSCFYLYSTINIAHSSLVTIHRHTNISEFVVSIYGSVIELFYDVQGDETETVVMKAGRDIFRHLQNSCIHHITFPKRIF